MSGFRSAQVGGPDAVAAASIVGNVLQTQNQILTQLLTAANTSEATQNSILTALNNIHTAIQTLAPVGPQATQQITGNGQTIAVGANGSVVLTTTTGGNMTGMILSAGGRAGQIFTIINTTIYTITFTSSVSGTPTQAASSAQDYIWDGTNSNWKQVV